MVDFGHDWGVGFYRDVSPSTIPGIDVDGDGLTTDDVARGWAFSLTTPLNPSESTFDSQLPSARFYGGVYAAIANRAGSSTSSAPSEGHINQNHEMRDDWNLMALPSQSLRPELESYEAAGLWLWKKEDFLNGGNQTTVSFASPDDYISVYISRYWGGVNWGRWVIQSGGQFFISEPTFGNITHQVKLTYDANNNIVEEAGGGGGSNPVYKTGQTVRPTQVRWAPYDPTRAAPRAMFFDWQVNPDYQHRTFADVQSVGFLVQRDLALGAQVSPALTLKEPIAVKWNAVRVRATLGTVPSSAALDVVPIGTGPQLLASRTEVTYRDWLRVQRWAVSNQRARNFTDGVDRFIPVYSFERDGAIGSAEASLAAEHTPLEPVTTVSWYDAIVWCNALSEMEGREPAYYSDAAFTKPVREVFRRNLPRQHGSSSTGTRNDRPVVYWKSNAGGYRLPTEGEWKALAADASDSASTAWTSSNANNKTQPVATRAANNLGLHDMVGNVAEYIWDAPGTIFDPAAQTQHKVMGGSFRLPANENSGGLIPFAHRPWAGTYNVGFRPVRSGSGGLPAGSGTFPERIISSALTVPPASPMSEEALRIQVRNIMPLVEVAGAGSLAAGSTNTNVLTTSAYDLEVGGVEIPYALWIRVKQWGEATQGYLFNFSGDMGSARHNVHLTRGPNEPVTQVSWLDAVLWCNALSELMGLEPVYLDSNGNIEREVPPFRLTDYNFYGYPNLGQYSHTIRPEIDTALIGYTPAGSFQITRLLPNPVRTGFRLPTGPEARAYSGTVYNHWEAANKTTTAFGWFRDDPAFGGNATLLKAMPVGTKTPKAGANGLHDVLGNVQEWTFGGSSLFGQYRFGNDFGFASTNYPHTMNRQDHLSSARAYLGFRVVKVKGDGNLPPSFEGDPLVRELGYVGQAYAGTIAGTATDPNPGDAVTYSKVSGPAWLQVAADGTLSGSPTSSDAGMNSFQVRATDFAGAGTTVALQIEISASALPPSFDPPGGTFEGAGAVQLTSITPGVTGFRYTTDGSLPTATHGTLTTGMAHLSTVGTVNLRAVALHASLQASPVAEAAYTIQPGVVPALSAQPTGEIIGVGWTTTLSASASGTGPLSFQWYRNGALLAGATGSTLTLSSTSEASAGNYTVTVTSPYGSVTSQAATISVVPGLLSTQPYIEIEPTPLTLTLLSNRTVNRTVTVRNSGRSRLNYEIKLPAGSAPQPTAETALEWIYAGKANGLGINQVANTGNVTCSWQSLSGASTLNGTLRIRTATDLNSYTTNASLGFSSGVHILQLDLAGWNIPNQSVGQWLQISFQNAQDAAVTAGLVLQTTSSGVALWGRALGTGGTNISGNGTWTETSSTEGIGSRTPARIYGFTNTQPVSIRLVANFTTRTYELHVRDANTAGQFVKVGGTGAISSSRNGNAMRLRMTGNWADTGEYMDLETIRVTRPAAVVVQNYTAARSSQGGPAYAWREISNTASGGTRVTALDNQDDWRTSVAFPGGFTFEYFGNAYSSLGICSNGFLSFTSTSTTYTNASLPSTSAPYNLIAPFWDDLIMDSQSSIWTRKDADAFVVTFNNMKRYSGTERVTMQVLFMANGEIRFQHQNVVAGGWSATVGIQNGNGTMGVLISHNTASTLPGSGEAITFIPPGGDAGVTWITRASPADGSLAMLEEEDITIGFDTTGLTPGSYESAVVVHSNDPATPAYSLPVLLEVVSQMTEPVIQTNSLPSATVGTAYSRALTHLGGMGAVTWSVASGVLPQGLGLAPDGTLSGTPLQHGSSTFTVRVTDAQNQSDAVELSLVVQAPPPPVISTTTLGDGQVNVAYSRQLQAGSGLPPYNWMLLSGSLPAGLTLGSGGLLAGTPSGNGNFSFTVRLTDHYAQTADQVLTLAIAPPPPLGLAISALPPVLIDSPYAFVLQATGGYGTYTWSLTGGSLPAGLSLMPNGTIAGTTGEAGTFPVTLTVSDERGNTSSGLLYLVVSATPAGRPEVEAGGWNLTYIRYWSQANFFNDAMFEASRWEHNWNAYAFEYDANGYPINIPAGITPAAKITLQEPGHYTLLWQGAGSSVVLNASGITLVSEDLTGEVKRRVYNKTSGERSPLLVRVMIQNQIPATGIRVLAPGSMPGDGSPEPIFKAGFLERLQDNSAALRFMDWGATNAATHAAWSERRRPGFYTQDSPTAYEYMIALANAANKDLWICVPHTVDAQYIQNLATLILHGTDGGVRVVEPLAPHLKVYVEWSNEVWNSQFPQHAWALALARTRLGLGANAPLPNYNEVWKIIGEKHAQTFRIFADVFRAAGQSSRLVRVLGTQIGGSLVGLHMTGIESIASAEADPALRSEYYPDCVAVGAYFGHAISTWVVNNTNYTNPGPADYNAAFAAVRSDILTTFRNYLRTSSNAAANHALELIAYEGGQHIVGVGSEQSNSALSAFLRTMNRDPRMGEMTSLALDLWEMHGGGLFMAYNEASPYGSYGSWGFREHWYQELAEAPKAAAFNNWLRRMQQSHLLSYELTGTALGDPLGGRLDFITRTAPIHLSISGGALPQGLSINHDGTFGGVAQDYGRFTFTVQLADGAGKVDRRTYSIEVTPETRPTSLLPTADANALSWAATTNYGGSVDLLAGASTSRLSYLKWDLSGYDGKSITSAKVRISRKSGSGGNARFYQHDGAAWTETGLTWNNRPSLGSLMATFPVDGNSTVHEVDVTAWANSLRGNAHAGLVLVCDNNIAWHSKESTTGNGPALVIEADPLVLFPNTVANWQKLHFGSSAAPGAALLADPFGTGTPNLLAMALGLNPNQPGQPMPYGLTHSPQDGLVFQFPIHSGHHELRIVVEASTDLHNWNEIVYDSTTANDPLAPGWNTIEIELPAPTSANPRKFLRLRAEVAEP